MFIYILSYCHEIDPFNESKYSAKYCLFSMLDILNLTELGRKLCNSVPYNLSLNIIPSCLRTLLYKMEHALTICSQVVILHLKLDVKFSIY